MTTVSDVRRPDAAGLRVRAESRGRRQTPLDGDGLQDTEGFQSDAADATAGSSSPDRDAGAAGDSGTGRPNEAVNGETRRTPDGNAVLERIVRSVDAYSGATEQAFGDARALFDCWAILGRGLQQWQHTYMGMSEQVLSDLDQARRRILRCGTVLDVAELQRATSLDVMKRTVASNVALLQVAVQIGRDAVGPLRAREEVRRGFQGR